MTDPIPHPREGAEPPIFITGLPRSGTTLISMVLNAHSRISIAPETHYFSALYRKAQRWDAFANDAVFDRFIHYVLTHQHLEAFGLSEVNRENLAHWMKATGKRSHQVVLGTVLAFRASQEQKEIFGEKTPHHIYHLEEIWRVFPEARIINMIRDPRDMVLSMRRVPWGRGNMIERLGEWKRLAAIIDRYTGERPHQFTVVRYEDILADAEATVRQVCDFLKVGFEPSMLHYEQHADPNFDLRTEPWKAKNLQAIDPSNVMKWKRGMPKEECAIVDRLIGPEMSGLGYPLSQEPWDLRMRGRLLYFKLVNQWLIGQNNLQRLGLRLKDQMQWHANP